MNAKRLTRAEAKAQTREKLLNAAAHIFARKGYAGASVEEIAESAGFSVGAIYSNFGGKEELVSELLATHASGQVADAGRMLANIDSGAEEPIVALGNLLAAAADKDNDFALLQAELWLYAVRNPKMMDTMTERMRESHTGLRNLMQTALTRIDRQDDVSADDLATIVMALFQGLIRQRRINPDQISNEILTDALHWLFAGIAAKGKPTDTKKRQGKK
jgi:AcrR family transcriptional regulator